MQSEQTLYIHRLALRHAQPLAGVLSEASLLRRLVQVVRLVCNAASVQVYLLDNNSEMILRAYAEEHETNLVHAQSDILPDQFETPYIDDDQLIAPLMFEQMPLGVVCVELDSMDEHTQYHMLLTLGTICSFASAGLVNARTISENATSVDVSSIIERTRLAAMNELAAAVAHQLNNPLTTIVADAEILLLRAEKGTRTHAALTAIERSGQRAAEVVRRLMAVVRPDKLNGIAQPVDVVQTVENVLLLVRQYIQVEKIDVVTKYSDERPVVWVTPDILGDVWLNLLMNARDALIGKENAQIGIEVRYEPGDEETYVLIGDNGIGIPEQEMKAIFEPFYSTKPTAERMGLGLHISKRIVDGLGGTVRVRSNENTGTTFIVTLPVKKGA